MGAKEKEKFFLHPICIPFIKNYTKQTELNFPLQNFNEHFQGVKVNAVEYGRQAEWLIWQ